MSKVAVVFWSSTGNTEMMAGCVADGARAAGAEVDVFNTTGDTSVFDAGKIADYDAIAFGSPAMGDEELDEEEFEPFFASIEDSLSGVKVALFGSYDWGEGDWMNSWKDRCEDKGANVVDTVICNLEPDDEGKANCEALGKALV